MSSICDRCHGFDPSSFDPGCFTVIDAIPNPGHSDATWLPGLVCLKCNQCVALASSSARGSEDEIRWTRLGELLTEEQSEEGGAHQKSGWFEMEGLPVDWLRHMILNRVVYGINSGGPDKASFECTYSDPEPGLDRLFLLFDKGKAVGFCTLRSDDASTPPLSIIDTVFISREHRGRGHAAALLGSLLAAGQELGLSNPVSNGMLAVALRFLAQRREARERVWLVREAGGRRERLCLWWNAPKMARERGIDLKRVLAKKKKEEAGSSSSSSSALEHVVITLERVAL